MASPQIELNDVREVLRLYCRALSGNHLDVQDAQELSEKKIGWSQTGMPTTDGNTIYLPRLIDRYPAAAENFELLKVMATYQAAYLEFGTFDFRFERGSTRFRDLRHLPAILQVPKTSDTGLPATDMGRFFRLFPDQRLALDIFTIAESTRIESSLLREYRGIASGYRKIQEHALEMRPDIASLPAREALVEFMLRIGLGAKNTSELPSEHARAAARICEVLAHLSEAGATVEDTAETTLRLYALLIQIPNETTEHDHRKSFAAAPTTSTSLEKSDDNDFDANFVRQSLEIGLTTGGTKAQPAPERPYLRPQVVDYRGDFMPELGQLLSQVPWGERQADFSESAEPLTKDQIEELLMNAPELKRRARQEDHDDEPHTSDMLANLIKDLARRDPRNREFAQGLPPSVDDDAGALAATQPGTFVYDEWDFHAAEYKRRWCLVHEKSIGYGDLSFYRDTLSNHALLAERIRGEFELIAPEMHRKLKRLQDGEEHDLDAFIEAMTDLRAGMSPSEKLFWRRNKTERSVAAAFLIDMSASTAESIDEESSSHHAGGARQPGTSSVPPQAAWPPYRRIIDVEKESIVLLVNALELLGDVYGIYGFSGFGRDNVEFYVIKDMEESFSSDIAKRIDRIAPQHATRMGPAIRHAATKLIPEEAKSKFLFLISDGRPQDRGYSRDGIEKEYAVQDTRMALTEARGAGIIPFCLTVDKGGHDYLKAMMGDFSYEVLHDVSLLPRRLPQLYERLTK